MSVNFLINILTKGAKKSEKDVKGLNKALGNLKSQAMAAAGAFLGAGALVVGIKKATKAFAEQELAEKKLAQALGSSTTALLNQASALQKTSIFGDEATIAQQAFLASLKFSEDQIKTIIPVAMDLASATGMSLESAVRNTAKTFSGLAGELGEMVPQLRELTAEEMKAGKAVEVMAELFKGAASAETKTMTGALKQMSDAVGDAAENLGELLAPAVIDSAKFFKGAAEAVGGYLDSLRTLSLEEIRTTTNQERLAKEIGKVREELRKEERGVAKAGIGLETMGNSANFSQQKVVELEQKLELLEKRYASLSTATDDFNFGEFMLDSSKKSEEAAKKEKKIADELAKIKADQLKEDLASAALSGQSAQETMKSVVRAEYMKSVAKQISNILTGVPFPFNLAVAAGAGTLMSGVFDKAMGAIPSFATGGDFVTNGEQLIKVGDNLSGKEHVKITPLSSGGEPTGVGGGPVNITFNSPVMSADHTEQVIIPQIQEALRRGATL